MGHSKRAQGRPLPTGLWHHLSTPPWNCLRESNLQPTPLSCLLNSLLSLKRSQATSSKKPSFISSPYVFSQSVPCSVRVPSSWCTRINLLLLPLPGRVHHIFISLVSLSVTIVGTECDLGLVSGLKEHCGKERLLSATTG